MALSDEQIDGVTLSQWGAMKGGPLAAHRAYARAIEAEVRGQDDALIRLMLEALECSGEPDDPGHRCSHCDDYVDRNSRLRSAARLRLEGKP